MRWMRKLNNRTSSDARVPASRRQIFEDEMNCEEQREREMGTRRETTKDENEMTRKEGKHDPRLILCSAYGTSLNSYLRNIIVL